MTQDQFVKGLRDHAKVVREENDDRRTAWLLEEAADRLEAFAAVGAVLMRGGVSVKEKHK